MTPNTETLETWTPRALSVLRIVSGFLYIQHGMAKHFGFPHIAMFDHLPTFSLIGIAGMLEIVFGVLVLIGLFTRVAAFILSGEMAVAYFMAHASAANFLTPLLNQGESAVLYCFIFLFIAAAGAGPWSVDAMRSPNRRQP